MNLEKKKILIIDDDYRNIFALSAVLKAKGFDCISTLYTEEGLKLISHDQDIGILLIDMMMPEMDGYEAISHIRGIKGAEKLPIIAVTAQAMAGDREKCLEAGADGYISKPVDVDELLEVLNKFL